MDRADRETAGGNEKETRKEKRKLEDALTGAKKWWRKENAEKEGQTGILIKLATKLNLSGIKITIKARTN